MGPPLDPITSLRAALRGHYEIEREIGQGAYATVYLARDLKHERKVAIKVLHADPSSETGELRFIREIRLLARLQHPNILPLHDSGHVEALLYYVMPYVSGETLRDRIDREKQLPCKAACNIARDVADALAYAHAQGIIHRDIKPENVLLSAGHPILADFGIARVIDLAGVRQVTRTGMGSPGTPAYMSPEQLMGDKELDGRSDTYSLGCVLFEMLAGRPPFSGKEGFVKRFTEPPPSVSTIRKDVPRWLDNVVATALARTPTDRFQTAQELVAALSESPKFELRPPAGAVEHLEQPSKPTAVEEPVGEPAPSPSRVLKSARLKRLLLPLGIAAAVVAVAMALNQRNSIGALLGAPALDSSRVAILPFRGDKTVAAEFTRNLADAWGDWKDLRVPSGVEVAEFLPTDGIPSSLSEARAIAKQLRARQLVWGEVSRRGSETQARLELYDVGEPSAFVPRTLVLPQVPTSRDRFRQASVALLKDPNRPAWADGGDLGTQSFAAWNAYGEGHQALARWNLAEAERYFRRAIDADENYSAARVWLAQLVVWTHPDSADWSAHATRALLRPEALNQRDYLIAAAVASLATGDPPAACRSYTELTKQEPRNFIGWFGLGECQRLDTAVVRNQASRSGWAFRSSFLNARRMYMRALQLEPRAHAFLSFERMAELLPTNASVSRVGHGPPPDSAVFAAFPSLSADTLAFVPYPVAQFAALPPNATLTHNAALDRNSDLLLAFAKEWTRQFPLSADAHEAEAAILEARGEVADSRSGPRSALGAVLRALQLSSDSRQKLRLSTREVRLRLKRSEFARARSLADSLLSSHQTASPAYASELIGLAAMTGRIDQTARLGRLGGWPLPTTTVPIAPPLADAAAVLFARAALGACGPELTTSINGLDTQLRRYVPESKRAEIRSVLADRSFSLMTPCTNAKSAMQIGAPYDRLYRMQRAFAENNVRSVRATLDSLAIMRKTAKPNDLSLDYTFQESWLKSAIGDTTDAINQLDLTLGALSTLNGRALQDPGVAAALGRVMALRADLANGRHDKQAAQQWASALIVLWSGADRELQPTVSRMRELAAHK